VTRPDRPRDPLTTREVVVLVMWVVTLVVLVTVLVVR
jgi:hypothetical protein